METKPWKWFTWVACDVPQYCSTGASNWTGDLRKSGVRWHSQAIQVHILLKLFLVCWSRRFYLPSQQCNLKTGSTLRMGMKETIKKHLKLSTFVNQIISCLPATFQCSGLSLWLWSLTLVFSKEKPPGRPSVMLFTPTPPCTGCIAWSWMTMLQAILKFMFVFFLHVQIMDTQLYIYTQICFYINKR